MKYLFIFFIIFFFACGSEKESQENKWVGKWDARWETDPSGYPELSGQLDFSMRGTFTFKEDSITIVGFGYEGCIFSEDTIGHTLVWEISNDSLMLYNNSNTPGLSYKVVEASKNKIRLQLEDIFVSLTK